MNENRQIAVAVPADLLANAMAASGEGLDETVRRGLELIVPRAASEHLCALRGKVQFSSELPDLRDDRQ